MVAFISAGTGAAIFVRTGLPFVTRVSRRATLAGERLRTGQVLRRANAPWTAKDGGSEQMGSESVSEQVGVDLKSTWGTEGSLDGGKVDDTCEGIGIVSSRRELDGRVLFGEFLSTTLFILVTMMHGESPALAGPLSVAAMVGATAAAYMPVSGAHLNPAVTIALAATGRMNALRAMAFIPVQIIAAITGVFISRVLGASKEMPALPVSLSKSGALSAVLLEMLPMFIITCVIFLTSVATEKEGGIGGKLAPIYIALTVFACICSFQPAMFNPARAIAVGVFAGALKGHWVYWLGPIFGSVLAATVSSASLIRVCENLATFVVLLCVLNDWHLTQRSDCVSNFRTSRLAV